MGVRAEVTLEERGEMKKIETLHLGGTSFINVLSFLSNEILDKVQRNEKESSPTTRSDIIGQCGHSELPITGN